MSDWTTDATDAIERTVALLRDRTVEPAHAISKVIVYGLLAAIMLIPAGVMVTVALFRVSIIIAQGYVWLAWMIVGGIFAALGALCWALRNP
jgi:hypothetical protein